METEGTEVPTITFTLKMWKRFRIKRIYNFFLVRYITVIEAHLQIHGQTEAKYECVLGVFLTSHEFISKSNVIHSPKLNTMRDCYRDLVKERRIFVKQKLAASFIEYVYEDRKNILDKMYPSRLLRVSRAQRYWQKPMRTRAPEKLRSDSFVLECFR